MYLEFTYDGGEIIIKNGIGLHGRLLSRTMNLYFNQF
jgi:hypothetical protein